MRKTEFGWRACNKCGGLFVTEGDDLPSCKKGGSHQTRGNVNRGVPYDEPVPQADDSLSSSSAEEPFWHYCMNCHGLFRTSGDADVSWLGICNHAPPGSTAHVGDPERPRYVLERKPGSPTRAQNATAYLLCSKCGGLYHEWPAGTVCNAGGSHERQTIDLSGAMSGGWYYVLLKALG